MDAPASSVATPPPPASEDPLESAIPRRRSGGQKRKSLNFSSSSTPSKRLMKERYALNIQSSSPLHSGPVTRARQYPSKLASRPPEAVPRLETHDGRRDGWVPIGAEKEEEEEELVLFDEPIVDPEFDAVRSRGSDVHVVPVPAGWFSWEDVHPIEKQTLPSFFNGKLESRTPDIYMEIRNSVMKKFHADPQTQLEVKDLSEISVGDTKARQEVIEFLAHWGLINFHPFPPCNSEVSNWDTGEYKTSSSLVDKLYKFEKVQPCPRIVAKKVGASGPSEMPKLPESALNEPLVGPVGPSVEYHCNSCSADCSSKRYHFQKQEAFLTHLVEPDAAATSFRSSLKAMSEDSPGIELATRHCFILENLPNAVKDLPASDSAATDMGIGEAPKEEDQMPTSNGTNELKAPNGTDEAKPSNGIEELKPSSGSDELKPSNGSDEPKPSNGNNELKPSNGCDEPKRKNNNNELKSSNDTDEFTTFNDSDELKPSNCSDKLKSSNGNDELKPSNDSDELKTFNGSDELKPSNGSDESNNCPNKNEEGAVSVENETKVSLPKIACRRRLMQRSQVTRIHNCRQLPQALKNHTFFL
ncbi:SWI/SNF complex subunit SWI3D-like [Iris pallida]|uniref:SWI/SNF complex subunit SWI3D-like n=1 Tax=Iris pallida TaxID=29817 RepID=A0AAX6GEP3_IRIPA|nr:SWI/SNF complex subunit SWI3D-like [Iris pallida]